MFFSVVPKIKVVGSWLIVLNLKKTEKYKWGRREGITE